jgi:hypothetical protein
MPVQQTSHIDDTKTDDTAGSVSGTFPTTFTQALVTFEDNSCRWRSGGTDPTAVIGTRQDPGDKVFFGGNDYADFMRGFSYINLTPGSNASVQIAFLTGFDRA